MAQPYIYPPEEARPFQWSSVQQEALLFLYLFSEYKCWQIEHILCAIFNRNFEAHSWCGLTELFEKCLRDDAKFERMSLFMLNYNIGMRMQSNNENAGSDLARTMWVQIQQTFQKFVATALTTGDPDARERFQCWNLPMDLQPMKLNAERRLWA